MKQMRRRMIAHGRLANVSIDDSIDLIADAQRLFSNNLMRPHPLNRRVASRHIGNDGVVIVRIKPSLVANLPTGLSIERRVIKNDLAGFASLQFLHALPVANDRQHFTTVGASLPIPFEDRFRKLLICWIRSLFSGAFPGGTSAVALLSHGLIEAFLVKNQASIAHSVLNKI